MDETKKMDKDDVCGRDDKTDAHGAPPAPEDSIGRVLGGVDAGQEEEVSGGEDVRHEPKGEENGREVRHRRRMKALRSLLIRTALFLLVVYILFFHLVGLTTMPSQDMYPRLDGGDLVLYYRLETRIRSQDIIVFEKPSASLELSYAEAQKVEKTETVEKPWWRKTLNWLGFSDPTDGEKTLFICRVVAGPGDTVEITEDETLVINGNVIFESGIFYPTPRYEGFVDYPLTLGENEYFVLADRRNGGADSRFFGCVAREEIKGTVITILRRNGL